MRDRIVEMRVRHFTRRDGTIMRRETLVWASGLIDSVVVWAEYLYAGCAPA